MKAPTLIFVLLVLACTSGPPHVEAYQANGAPWSQKIAASFLLMHPDSIIYPDEEKSRKWNYEQGVMLEGFYQMWKQTGDSTYLKYVRKNIDYYVREDGTIATYDPDDFNLDNIGPGRTLIRMFELTGLNKYRLAADRLRAQLRQQPRTRSGGFWHKKIYPYQMWLDGLYMSEPFYVSYARSFGDSAAFDDVAHQFQLIRKHLRDSSTGLYFHGWDESHRQPWADPVTGHSPNFWGRSIGWLSMALVDVLELLPEEHPQRKALLAMFVDLSESLWRERDPETNLWSQVVNKQGAQGNYLEASVSAMAAYAFAKGARLGYLPSEFKGRAEDVFDGIVKSFVSQEQGVVHLHHVCSVGGLGGKPYRDGSFSYYVGESQRTDDFKGYGPFLLAAIELERLGRMKD